MAVLQRHSQDDGIIDTCTSGRAGRQGCIARHPMIPPSCFRDPTGTRNMALHKSPSPRTVAEKELHFSALASPDITQTLGLCAGNARARKEIAEIQKNFRNNNQVCLELLGSVDDV